MLHKALPPCESPVPLNPHFRFQDPFCFLPLLSPFPLFSPPPHPPFGPPLLLAQALFTRKARKLLFVLQEKLNLFSTGHLPLLCWLTRAFRLAHPSSILLRHCA